MVSFRVSSTEKRLLLLLYSRSWVIGFVLRGLSLQDRPSKHEREGAVFPSFLFNPAFAVLGAFDYLRAVGQCFCKRISLQLGEGCRRA